MTREEIEEAANELIIDCNFSEEQKAKVEAKKYAMLEENAMCDEVLNMIYSTLGGVRGGTWVVLDTIGV